MHIPKCRYMYNILCDFALNRCTVQPFTESDDTRCCVNTIFPPEDAHVNARNMLMNKELCIKVG